MNVQIAWYMKYMNIPQKIIPIGFFQFIDKANRLLVAHF